MHKYSGANSPFIVYIDSNLKHNEQPWWTKQVKRYIRSQTGAYLNPSNYVKYDGKRPNFKKFTNHFHRRVLFKQVVENLSFFSRVNRVKPDEHDEPRCDCGVFTRCATCGHCLVWLHLSQRLNLDLANTPMNRKDNKRRRGVQPPVPGAQVIDNR